MGKTIKVVLVTSALFGGTLIAGLPTMAADVSVNVGTPDVAFGYSDGYWDRNHTWHDWKDQREASAWRDEHRDHYYEWKHDRDPDKGWHDDHWWDRH